MNESLDWFMSCTYEEVMCLRLIWVSFEHLSQLFANNYLIQLFEKLTERKTLLGGVIFLSYLSESLDWLIYKLMHSGVFLIHSLKRTGSRESESQKLFIGESYYTGWAALVEECRYWKTVRTECHDNLLVPGYLYLSLNKNIQEHFLYKSHCAALHGLIILGNTSITENLSTAES